ncbi:MAG: hypothetical protein Q8M24_04370 [Pseudolabrys sp.]|nr:hypothetical protein [Pseudolabrys sp.]MDP2294682.1 hypothetical protein [Pseudolabrys sp.]
MVLLAAAFVTAVGSTGHAQTQAIDAQAQPAVPAPGATQPIAAPPEPAPQAAAAPPVELPQVSPVEQFELSGSQRIAPRSAATRSLNLQASGAVNLTQPSNSGRWTFTAVPETPFVRIKTDAKNAHLTDVNGQLRATLSAPDSEASHWTFEPVDGTMFVQLRNRATDRILMAVNGSPALVQDYRQDQETLSHWEVSPAGSAAAVVSPPPPRDTAYDDAVGSCRDIGGYWTGSSCRSLVISRPLVCPRGWAWYADVGECLWDGGSRCPPWQMGAGGSCLSDLSCKNGRVRLSARGYPVCDCPPGTRTWGRYPKMACISSLARNRPSPVLAPAPSPLSNAAARAAQQRLQADRVRQQNEQRARDRLAAAQQAAALRAARLQAERDRAAAVRKAAIEKAAADRAAAAARVTPGAAPRPVRRPAVICRPPLRPNNAGGCVP